MDSELIKMIEMIQRAFRYGNFRYKVFCFLIGKLGYSNLELQDLQVRNKVFAYMEKKYGKKIECQIFENDSVIETENKKVWVCWLQGYDKAPEIVKCCIKSMRKWLIGYEVIIIDENNLFDYVDLPNYIISKWRKGVITNTLFSDFIRLSVLKRFGGIWIDSTVYFTGPLPSYIESSHIFMYRCNGYDVAKFGESWFIKAPPNNFVITKTLHLMNEYWKKENKIRDYFQMFIFMKMIINRYPQEVGEMINIPSAVSHMLQSYLNNNFEKEIFDSICSITSIHKLTYKGIDVKKDNTFMNYILKMEED